MPPRPADTFSAMAVPYHERQRWRHCAKHALNALLEGHAALFSAGELYAAGRALPDAGSLHLLNPHYSIFGGNFDINVLIACAQQRGFQLDWHDRRKPVDDLVAGGSSSHGLGFLVNVRRRHFFGAWSSNHWLALRCEEGALEGSQETRWHRIDSQEAGPVARSAVEVVADLQAVLALDGNLLVLRPQLPEAALPEESNRGGGASP